MAELKTKATTASVADYLASRASAEQLADCKAIMAMCRRATKKVARMWGPSIVGYGSFTYTYDSGRSGVMPLIGFAIRGRELVIYIASDSPKQRALLAKLGKHRMSKACLYIKRIADVDARVLEALIAGTVAEIKRRDA